MKKLVFPLLCTLLCSVIALVGCSKQQSAGQKKAGVASGASAMPGAVPFKAVTPPAPDFKVVQKVINAQMREQSGQHDELIPDASVSSTSVPSTSVPSSSANKR